MTKVNIPSHYISAKYVLRVTLHATHLPGALEPNA